MRVVVTGGAGFIGSALCRYLVAECGWQVLNIDKLTYAADQRSLAAIEGAPGYRFMQADIADGDKIARILDEFKPDAIMHLAAESHVDRSIDGPGDFIETNIVGTYRLLDAALYYWRGLAPDRQQNFRFLHVSTDEVYGSLGAQGLFDENSRYQPNSPYSASKASSDHLVRAWHHTYGLPILISNCSNNYGPFQFPEKFIPLMILNAMAGRKLPVYGDGHNIRDWLHVNDHVAALRLIVQHGQVGETYNVGGRNEARNIDIVHQVISHVRDLSPHRTLPKDDALIEFVQDRPGHDRRYAIDATKLENRLGWQAQYDLDRGLRDTVAWYLNHEQWWQPILDRKYQGQRLGVA
ncbi:MULTISPECIES: dTDP-glucose 4,6-dehydratase [unclassified Thalassospira]|uniref:dTDP-glucose 4,6-dehydratase n=1 Tax=unclassified Thalassospira TaxID=2648997 RepID=UPI000A1EF924|nr:dTDP-glucose 4,6-dehydratase [Thalassospira sp. MCCC 1A01428]OSQ41731.1 dTDP-glucose 4,6-dehydratase [Thalassospira sp. MCCC 1A01428]